MKVGEGPPLPGGGGGTFARFASEGRGRALVSKLSVVELSGKTDDCFSGCPVGHAFFILGQ